MTKRILVIEDQEDNRQILRDLLETVFLLDLVLTFLLVGEIGRAHV